MLVAGAPTHGNHHALREVENIFRKSINFRSASEVTMGGFVWHMCGRRGRLRKKLE